MDDIQNVIIFLINEISGMKEQKADTDTILAAVYKEIDGDTRVKHFEIALSAMQELQQYRQIGTLEECREARVKQMPIKPKCYTGTNRADCPSCGGTVRGIGKPWGDWCSKCGQAIDWSDEHANKM